MVLKKTFAAVVGLFLASSGSAWPGEDEKLLFGFEKEECEKAAQDKSKGKAQFFKSLEDGEFLFYKLVAGTEREMPLVAIRPLRCVPEKASQGKYSCKVVEPVENQFRNAPRFRFPRLPVYDICVKTPQANLRHPELLNTSGWYDWVFPKDWSGYDLLRVDVLLERPQNAGMLMLEVEDDLVEPPVSLTYDVPPQGQWVTLEMDLSAVSKERGLNLTKMANVWVRLFFKDHEQFVRELMELHKAKNQAELEKRTFLAYVDNVRLCRKGAPCATPVLQGKRSRYTETLPRSYAVDVQFINHPFATHHEPVVVPVVDAKMPEPAKAAPEPGPTASPEPSLIPIREMIVKGCLAEDAKNGEIFSRISLMHTAALDQERIAVGFGIKAPLSLRASRPAEVPGHLYASAAVGTLDGGTTWKGLDGTEWPTVIGDSQKVSPWLSDLGGDLMNTSDFGCRPADFLAQVGYPADRSFFTRTVLTDKGWWVGPKYLISGDVRHCHHLSDVTGSPSGRLWTCWRAANRYSDAGANQGGSSLWIYHSDDGGATWSSWRGPGLNGTVPSFRNDKPALPDPQLVPYRGYVAVLAGSSWSRFDGEAWTALEEIGAKCCSAVTCGDEIYVSTAGDGPARWYDGKAWQDFTVPGRTGKLGRISVCGWKRLFFVEADASGTKLLCWRKDPGGPWTGPDTLVTEETPLADIATPNYAPEGFVPVAYTCWESTAAMEKASGGKRSAVLEARDLKPWIKVLKVPAEASR